MFQKDKITFQTDNSSRAYSDQIITIECDQIITIDAYAEGLVEVATTAPL